MDAVVIKTISDLLKTAGNLMDTDYQPTPQEIQDMANQAGAFTRAIKDFGVISVIRPAIIKFVFDKGFDSHQKAAEHIGISKAALSELMSAANPRFPGKGVFEKLAEAGVFN